MPPSSETPASRAATEELWHLSLSDDREATIIFLHGAGSCHLEFSLVTTHLPEYHLLLVDLPGHSASSHIQPFSLRSAVDLIATLIRTHAHNKVAHVVGVSSGGVVALDLAKRYLDVVISLFISGFAPVTGWRATMVTYPTLAYTVLILPMTLMPQWLFIALWGRMDMVVSQDLARAQQSNMTRALMRDMWGAVRTVTMADVGSVKVRALAVAAGKQDDLQGMREMGMALRAQCDNSRAVVIRGAVHLWNLQRPRLFADCVRAWIEDGALPEDCEEL